MNEKQIQPIAIPGIHNRFLTFLESIVNRKDNLSILDFGAGHGAFSEVLYNKGHNVSACDRFPEKYEFGPVECLKITPGNPLPYDDESFDVIVAIEVMEHIYDHDVFFKEANRILRPGGRLILTTPNILSLKSRMMFLLSGFYYSFEPLRAACDDGLQHVSSLTYDQFNNLAVRNGFKPGQPYCDKFQKSSRYLLILWPLIRLYCKIKGVKFGIHNCRALLLGRILFLNLLKEDQ